MSIHPQEPSYEVILAQRDELLAALEHAHKFIRNGIDFGYIRLPEMPQDAAHETIPMIEGAIQRVKADLAVQHYKTRWPEVPDGDFKF